MRRTLLLLLTPVALIFSKKSLSQVATRDMISKTWRFTMPVALKECDEFGKELVDGKKDTTAKGYEFKVSYVKDAVVVIYFVTWYEGIKKDSKEKPNDNSSKYLNEKKLNIDLVKKSGESELPTDPKDYRKFVMTRDEFEKNCEEKVPKNQLSMGAVTLPIKIRFANKSETNKVYSSFEGNVSVGLSVGNKTNYNNGKWSTIIMGGIALSSVPVDSTTTKHFVEGKTNASAVTLHVGFLVAIDNFQIGLFTGIDYLSGKINHQWDYRNRPWVGIGIGFSFFNAKKTTDTQ